MSVEIKELIIRAVAESGDGDGAAPGASTQSELERTELIQACVREVLRVLARSKER